MNNPDPTSVTLLSLARNGDSNAWSRLVDIYGPMVYAQCKRRNLSEDDAADITQEVFLALHGGLRSFRKERPDDKFSHWLRRITSFKIADRIRLLIKQERGLGGSTAQLLIEQLPEEIEAQWEPDPLSLL